MAVYMIILYYIPSILFGILLLFFGRQFGKKEGRKYRVARRIFNVAGVFFLTPFALPVVAPLIITLIEHFQ